MFKKNQSLKTLYFCDYSVGVEGALELIESLKHNTTLEKLAFKELQTTLLFNTRHNSARSYHISVNCPKLTHLVTSSHQ